jgi:hypothetical protein
MFIRYFLTDENKKRTEQQIPVCRVPRRAFHGPAGELSLPFLIVILFLRRSFSHRLLLISPLRHRIDGSIHDLFQLSPVFPHFHLLCKVFSLRQCIRNCLARPVAELTQLIQLCTIWECFVFTRMEVFSLSPDACQKRM